MQKSALIQPRTSLSTFADAYKLHPPNPGHKFRSRSRGWVHDKSGTGLPSRPRPETNPNQDSRALIVQQTCRSSFSAVSKPTFQTTSNGGCEMSNALWKNRIRPCGILRVDQIGFVAQNLQQKSWRKKFAEKVCGEVGPT